MIEKLHILTPDDQMAEKLETAASGFDIEATRSISSSEFLGGLRREQVGTVLVDHSGCKADLTPLLKSLLRQHHGLTLYLFNVPFNDQPGDVVRLALTGMFEQGVSADQVVAELVRQSDLLDTMKSQGMYGQSSELVRAAESILRIAETDVTVLIGGESGTGKEMFANAIHNLSRRKGKPFIAVNCGAIAEGILESELFGHEKGAFTGASGRRQGYFEAAEGGTIFLDEIGEVEPAVQVRLLRVLEQRTFMRVGGTEQISVDVRVIAASNRDLKALSDDARFREDLYYRLSVVSLTAAPLRQRPVDIIPIVSKFMHDKGRDEISIEPSAVELLLRYSWPGNIRELRNFVESSLIELKGNIITQSLVSDYISRQTASNRQLPVATGQTRQEVDFQLIYQALLNLAREVAGLRTAILGSNKRGGEPHTFEAPGSGLSTEIEVDSIQHVTTIQDMERDLIARALDEVGGNRRKAAEKLGIGQRTLYRKIKEYGLQ